MDKGAGAGHHLRGSQQAPQAGQLQGQAAAVQARQQVHTQRDLLMDQVPRQRLEGRPTSEAGTGSLPAVVSGSRQAPASRNRRGPQGQRAPTALPFQRGRCIPTPAQSQCSAPRSARTCPDLLRLFLQRSGLLSEASLPHPGQAFPGRQRWPCLLAVKGAGLRACAPESFQRRSARPRWGTSPLCPVP